MAMSRLIFDLETKPRFFLLYVLYYLRNLVQIAQLLFLKTLFEHNNKSLASYLSTSPCLATDINILKLLYIKTINSLYEYNSA